MKTLLDLRDDFLADRRHRGYSPNTLRGDAWTIAHFLAYLRDCHQVATADRLRSLHVTGYQRRLLQKPTPKGTPLKPRAINNQLIPIRLYLRYLHRQGFTPQPLDREVIAVKEPQMLPASVLTHAQVKKLLRQIDTTAPDGLRDRALLELLYSTGLRSGELAALTLDDLDLPHARLKVLGKGNKERVVPVGVTALRYLESYLKAVRPFVPGHHRTRSVFLNRRGRPYAQKSLQEMVKRYAARAHPRLPVSPHTFRRSCATELVKANAPLYHVKELLGHASLISLQPYIRLAAADLQKTHAKCHPREKDAG